MKVRLLSNDGLLVNQFFQQSCLSSESVTLGYSKIVSTPNVV